MHLSGPQQPYNVGFLVVPSGCPIPERRTLQHLQRTSILILAPIAGNLFLVHRRIEVDLRSSRRIAVIISLHIGVIEVMMKHVIYLSCSYTIHMVINWEITRGTYEEHEINFSVW